MMTNDEQDAVGHDWSLGLDEKQMNTWVEGHADLALEQFRRDHPLHILSLIADDPEHPRVPSHQERMARAYASMPMDEAIKEFPYLYDIYARKAAIFQQASRDFAQWPDKQRQEAMEQVMRDFDANAVKTIRETDMVKLPRASELENRIFMEMKRSGDTAPLSEFHTSQTGTELSP